MLLQVPDNLLFEVPEAEANDTSRLVKAVMEGACAPRCELSVPLVVETGYGSNWDERIILSGAMTRGGDNSRGPSLHL